MKVRVLTLLWLVCLCSAAVLAASRKFTLVIDAGHGGHDAGARGKLTNEKTINLNVALAFGRYVERNCPDVKVIYTRKSDVFIPLHTRADIANRNKADLFISIHTNALPKGRISRGMETYTLGMHRAADNLEVAKRENEVILYEKDYKQRYQGFDPNSSESYIMFEFMQDHNMAQSVELAKAVQRRTCAIANRQDKGVKQAGFLVLRETSMPSCLIELGFISTSDEEQFLHTDSGVDKLARGIYEAFIDYRRKYDNSITVPYKPVRSSERVASEPPAAPQPAPQSDGSAKRPAESATRSSDPAPQAAEPAQAPQPAPQPAGEPPVFRVQVVSSDTRLKVSSPLLKGRSAFDCYQEDGKYKYTIGESTDFNEINRLCSNLQRDFPGAFVIAFRQGQRMDVNEAIREFKANKKKR